MTVCGFRLYTTTLEVKCRYAILILRHHKCKNMSTKRRSASAKTDQPLQNATHHLSSLVVAFVAILGALSINTYYSRSGSNVYRPPKTAVRALELASTPSPNTPRGLTTLSGFVKETNGNRVSLKTTVTENGMTTDRVILVSMTPQTAVYRIEPSADGVRDNTPYERRRVSVSRRVIRNGAALVVHAPDVVDYRTSIVADEIDIYSNR